MNRPAPSLPPLTPEIVRFFMREHNHMTWDGWEFEKTKEGSITATDPKTFRIMWLWHNMEIWTTYDGVAIPTNEVTQ